MKIKIIVLDFETPKWLRRSIVYGVLFLVAAGVGCGGGGGTATTAGTGGAGGTGGAIPIPANSCENINCGVASTLVDGGREYYVTGNCAAPCACALYVQAGPNKPWVNEGQQHVNLTAMGLTGYAAVCR